MIFVSVLLFVFYGIETFQFICLVINLCYGIYMYLFCFTIIRWLWALYSFINIYGEWLMKDWDYKKCG